MLKDEKIKWRGRLGYFVARTKPHVAYIRLLGNTSAYRVSIHELRKVKEIEVKLYKVVENDPLSALIIGNKEFEEMKGNRVFGLKKL